MNRITKATTSPAVFWQSGRFVFGSAMALTKFYASRNVMA